MADPPGGIKNCVVWGGGGLDNLPGTFRAGKGWGNKRFIDRLALASSGAVWCEVVCAECFEQPLVHLAHLPPRFGVLREIRGKMRDFLEEFCPKIPRTSKRR